MELFSLSTAHSRFIAIDIIDRKEAAPRFVIKPKSVSAPENSTVNLHAAIMSASDPIVTWYHNDVQLSQSVKHMQKYQGGMSFHVLVLELGFFNLLSYEVKYSATGL